MTSEETHDRFIELVKDLEVNIETIEDEAALNEILSMMSEIINYSSNYCKIVGHVYVIKDGDYYRFTKNINSNGTETIIREIKSVDVNKMAQDLDNKFLHKWVSGNCFKLDEGDLSYLLSIKNEWKSLV